MDTIFMNSKYNKTSDPDITQPFRQKRLKEK